MKTKQTLGVILAGGASSRMGKEKALVEIDGRPMIRHVFDRLAPQVTQLVISGPGDFGLGVPAIPDMDADRLGPMAGIRATGLWAEKNFPDMEHLITVPVDGPFLADDLVESLIKKTPSIAATDQREHPTFANWGPKPYQLAQAFSGAKLGKSLMAFADFTGAHKISFPSEKSFTNINSPTDLKQI